MLNLNLENKKALLFDVDGTIADTMPAHDKAYELAFALNEVPFSLPSHQYFAPMGGKVLMQKTVVEQRFGHKVEDIIRDKQRLLPFALEKYMRPNSELVKFIKKNSDDYNICFVSNGRSKSVEQVLERLGLTYHADFVVTSDVLGSAKPSPEAYNYAMLLLNLKPDQVIVFEDNQIGIDSATAAGIKDIIKVNTEDFTHEKL
jgi:HAD superfamily hydrolase (TIGR01509 family)